VVYLLDKTLIRIGNDEYARHNKSYGLTTLKNRHVELDGSVVRFHFVGKSGKEWSAKIRDRRVAKIIRACQDLPGQELLQYYGDDDAIQNVTSSDVNDYLREITGRDITAKDFRTWAGTVLAAIALKDLERPGSANRAKKRLRAAIETVAARLGNTPAICRKCYVHPEVLNAFLEGTLARALTPRSENLLRGKFGEYAPEEAAVLALLRSRLKAATNGANGGGRLRQQLASSVRRPRQPRTHRLRASHKNASDNQRRSRGIVS
jgi:DNA topoisomerase-1